LGSRFGAKRITAIFYIATVIPTVVLAWQISTVGLTNIPVGLFRTLILSHALLFGMGYGVRIALFMGMTNPAVAATQFTAYMALSNVAISLGNYWQGMVAERMDYSVALYLDAAIVILAVSVMPFLKDREEKRPEAAALREQSVAI
jgi:PAT family beta-lactamase induction signal transducer AmpG